MYVFLSPPEVNGVSYKMMWHILVVFYFLFPSPFEVTGVSYPISCIGSSRQTTKYSLTSQLKLILIIA